MQIVGPVLLYAEVTSVLRLRVATGRLTGDDGEAAFSAFSGQGIVKLDRDDLHLRAWDLAKRYGLRRAYDATYLALADLEDIELWTGDTE